MIVGAPVSVEGYTFWTTELKRPCIKYSIPALESPSVSLFVEKKTVPSSVRSKTSDRLGELAETD